MRTTLTLDDDIADFLKRQARLLNKPFKKVVNETLRRGMPPAIGERPRPEYRITPNRSGLAPGIDPLKLNQLNDQLEAEDFRRTERELSSPTLRRPPASGGGGGHDLSLGEEAAEGEVAETDGQDAEEGECGDGEQHRRADIVGEEAVD